ncbi:MAG TPA: CdaR family protein [Magnetospirillaceae bacterium]|nr:CdaR family protein [Magnetospirillaceae bacterium]
MSRKPFPERILENWPAKILSFMAAVFLFSFNRLNRLEERPMALPLRVVAASDLAPASPYPRTVRVVLKGEAHSIFAIQEGDLEAVLDISPFRAEGVYRIPVVVEKRGSAYGIDPLEIRVDPADIAISLEQRISRSVAIVPSFRGFLDPGYELAASELTPQIVEIEGPASLVRLAEDVTTESIELSGRREDFSKTVRILLRDALLSIKGPGTVEFRASIQRSVAFRSFEGLNLSVEHLAPGLAVAGELPAGTLRVVGPRDDLSFLVPLDGTLHLDLGFIAEPGVYTVPVKVRVPAGIAADAWTPGAVTLTIVAAAEVSR